MEINDKMPQYPFSFVDAVAVCWFPSIWYRIANPLVDKALSNTKFSQDDLKNTKYWLNLVAGVLLTLLIVNVWTANFQDGQPEMTMRQL